MAVAKFFRGRIAFAIKPAFIAALTLTFCQAHPGFESYAQRKPAKHGVLKIRTMPGGLPLQLDGKSYGATTTDDRSIDLPPGLHTIVITLPDGQSWTREFTLDAGRIKCVALNYRPAPPPLPASPCPFPVNLSAPSQVNEGEIITYTADVTYKGSSALTYIWTVSPANARILSGVGTPTITVDSTGLGGQQISAVLVVDDGSNDPVCRQTAAAATYVPPPPPAREDPAREYDTCCSCTFDDQKARLDNLAIELQNDPATTTYIIAYGGRTSRVGQADMLSTRAKEYLTAQRGIDASRIVVLNGGYREEDCVELWLVPSGANPPRPTPTVSPGDVRRPRERGRN
jgi:hypothetical protein